MRHILLMIVIALAVTVDAAEPRIDLDLNGEWEFKKVDNLDAPPGDGDWKPFDVPGYLRGYRYERAWFRRSFNLPESMRGKRIKIRFGGVKYNSRVFVNGKRVGGCYGGYSHFEVDATDTVRFDGPNELLVGCHDWTGVFSPGEVDFGRRGRGSRVRDIPRDQVLAPIGGLVDSYGIWGDVMLEAQPTVYVRDLFIKPSVRRGELQIDYAIANESGVDVEVSLRAAVEEAGQDVVSLQGERLQVAAGTTASITLRQAWPSPHLWSHEDPHLYHLRTELSTGDVLRTRFGFREFWIEGHDFYLNGSKVHLLGSSGWPPRTDPMTADEVRERWESLKRAGIICFRTHTQPWRRVHYDVADEVGMLISIEGAVWNDDQAYRVNDPVFWDNYAAHLRAMVDRHKNHPSVILWSLENEFAGGRVNDDAPCKADLVRMGRLMKEWDPTRPIEYESDGDPDGVADVINIHYPHEYPFYTCFPNEAYLLAEPQSDRKGRMFLNGAEAFFWDKKKPLYVGEFLWLPSHDPSWHTVFYGDEAYIDYPRYRNMAKRDCWIMQVLGYRHHEVGGICPWTVMEGGSLDESSYLYQAHQYSYQHIAAYCHDYDSRFYSGERVRRRVEVFNDVLDPSDLVFTWTLTNGDEVVDRGGERLKLEPGEQRMRDVELRIPKVERRTALKWRLTLTRNGERVFEDTHDYFAFPRIPLPKSNTKFGLYDTDGDTKALFRDAGLQYQSVDTLGGIDQGIDVLIIGAGALKDGQQSQPVVGRVHPERAALTEFAAKGGRVLVLEQEAYPAGLFGVALSRQRSTMTYPAARDHPVLRGVEPADLKFWRGDHMVAESEPTRPIDGASRAIVVSGSAAGIDNAPLLERPIGRGCIVHSQMKLVEKCRSEPAAAMILANVLDYLARYESRSLKTGVAGGSEAYRSHLRELGLRFDDLTGRLGQTDLSAHTLILCRGEIEEPSRLRRFVEDGGNLRLHRPHAEALSAFCDTMNLALTLQPYTGTIVRTEDDDPLLSAITREDIYWLGEAARSGASTTPRAQGMADGILSKTLAGKATASHEIETWKLSGQIVERRKPGVTFASAGTASADVDFAATGDYVIGVRAHGTPAFGVFPIAQILIDDEPLGAISVTSKDWGEFAISGRVEAGRHKVTVAFINDGSNPPREDRNLYVDKVQIARDDDPSGVTFLTRPAAVAVARQGKGSVIIDLLRWDTEEENARKAARYACSLLTALGGDFRPRLGVTFECEAMTPKPNLMHFSRLGTHVAMATNGYVEQVVEVAKSGRYTLELLAGGSEAEGVYPLVEILLDGKKIGQAQLTQSGWKTYPVEVNLESGTHNLRLAFVNDRNIPGVGDRNVQFDKVTFFAH